MEFYVLSNWKWMPKSYRAYIVSLKTLQDRVAYVAILWSSVDGLLKEVAICCMQSDRTTLLH